jgi:hypothetical protein
VKPVLGKNADDLEVWEGSLAFMAMARPPQAMSMWGAMEGCPSMRKGEAWPWEIMWVVGCAVGVLAE